MCMCEGHVCTMSCEGRSRSIVELKKNIESLRETMQTQRTQLRTLQHDLSDKYCTLTAVSNYNNNNNKVSVVMPVA